MARFLGFLAYFHLALAVVLLGLAGYFYWLGDDVSGAIIDEPDREFPSLKVGKNPVTFKLHNPTRHTVRVIGYSFC